MAVTGANNVNSNHACELCTSPGGEVLWESPDCRVIRVNNLNFPGFCRVIWNTHAREMTDLDPGQQSQLMSVVFAVEGAIRQLFCPDKINLASFGNMVPHVHWHVIPRWQNDTHFPEPIWGKLQRETSADRPMVSNVELSSALSQVLNIAAK